MNDQRASEKPAFQTPSIQRLLENSIDERSLHTKRTPKTELPTPECEAAIEAVSESF